MVLARRRGERAKGGLLAAFLLAKAFLMLRWFLFRHDILTYAAHLYIYRVSASGFFLLAPLLYLYVRALCYRRFRLESRHLLHLLPAAGFAALAALSVPEIQRLAAAVSGAGADSFPRSLLTRNFWDVFWGANFVQILFYIVGLIRTLRTYRAALQETHSCVDRVGLSWLNALLALISLHWVFVVTRGVLGFFDLGPPLLVAGLDLFSITIFLVFTTLLVIKGLGHVRVFAGIDAPPKYADSTLTEADVCACVERLKRYVQAEKPYLNPSLTLDELAAGMTTPPWRLSQVINRAFRQNFCAFINGYRLEEAKSQLADPANGKKTVLEILYSAGFNSKSVFHDAFKKHTGLTPTQYRKRFGAPGARAA